MKNLSAFGAVLLAANSGLSLAADDTLTLDPVIVTATRLDVANLPASVTVIEQKDIAASPAQTLPDLLELEAGVVGRSLYGNNAARDTIDLRGFGAAAGQNTLILLDGRRLNDVDLSHIDFSAIPLGNIERIEIVRGSGAVLYGDGAVGGAINIVTRGPIRSGTTGKLSVTGGSYDTQGVEAAISSGTESYGLNVFASAVDSDGYRENNELQQRNVHADARVRRAGDELFLKLGADDQNLRLPGERRVDSSAGVNQLATDRRGTNTPNDYSNQEGYALTTGWRHRNDRQQELIVDGGYRFKNQVINSEPFMSYVDSDLGTWSFTPRLKTPLVFGAGPGHFIAGLDYYQSQYESARAPGADTIGTPVHRVEVTQDSVAGYGQLTGEVATGTTVTAGARVQRVEFSGEDHFDPTAPGSAFQSGAPDMSVGHTETMYDLGVRQALAPAVSVFVRAGRSVRFGTVDETFGFDPVTFLQVFTPLKPQIAYTYELGADFASDARRRVGIAAYYMNLENEIAFNPATFANENLDPTRRYGATVTAAVPLSQRVRLKGDYAYTQAEFRAGAFDGNEVPLVPAHTGAITLFADATEHVTFATALRYVGSKRFDNDQSNTFALIPAYTMIDLKLTGRYGLWRIEGAVNNVFDEEAFDYGVRSTTSTTRYNAYPLPERNFSLTVARNF